MRKQLLALFLLALGNCVSAQTWTEQNTNYPVDNTYTGDLSIVDANIVWAMAQATSATNHQTFSMTTDGGQNWTSGAINVGNTTALQIGNISAVNATTAWVVAIPRTAAGLTTQGVFKTTDGGATWTKQTTAAYGGSGESFADMVHFWDANNGVVIGDKDNGYYEIYTTTNGGTNWTRTPNENIAISNGAYGYSGLYFTAGNTVWFGTEAGELVRSTDRGLNWTVTTTPVNSFASCKFAFKDDNNGVIQDTENQIFYVTTDGGTNWTTIATTGMFWGSIDYAGNTLVSGGSTADNYGSSYSTDNGVTWNAIDALSHTCLEFNSTTIGWGGGFTVSGVGGAFKFDGSTLSTNSFEMTKGAVYPNPANDVVTISLKTPEDFQVTVIDVTGKIISKKAFNGLENKLDVSSLSNGIYMLELHFADKNETVKLVKN